jgi:tRNA-dihydrouridine synthase C
LAVFWHQVQARVVPGHAPGRLKLWLNSLRSRFDEAETLYWAVRPLRGIDDVSRALADHGVPAVGDELPRAA